MQTLDGGIRIEAEDADDWQILRAIIEDANGPTTDLADRLGGLISDEAGAADWREYIVPDLREAFQDELAQVATAIESAAFHAVDAAGPLWIRREDGFAWYSALNQARLALEERYHFGPDEELQATSLDPTEITAFIRSKFYAALQSLLLEFVLI